MNKWMNFWLHWVFVATSRFLSLWCVGFSVLWLLLLHSMGLEGTRAQLLWHTGSIAPQLLSGTWDLSRPGIEPMSFALAGIFSTTGPPGSSKCQFFLSVSFLSLLIFWIGRDEVWSILYIESFRKTGCSTQEKSQNHSLFIFLSKNQPKK